MTHEELCWFKNIHVLVFMLSSHLEQVGFTFPASHFGPKEGENIANRLFDLGSQYTRSRL